MAGTAPSQWLGMHRHNVQPSRTPPFHKGATWDFDRYGDAMRLTWCQRQPPRSERSAATPVMVHHAFPHHAAALA